jgi:hypothetical protein
VVRGGAHLLQGLGRGGNGRHNDLNAINGEAG